MKLVKIDDVWINPKKVIMVQEEEVNPFNEKEDDIWTEIILEGNYPREHPGHFGIIDEPYRIHTYLPLDEVAAIINGGLE